MKKIIEAYLKEPHLRREEIKTLIEQISFYQGYLKKWKLFVRIENNKIHLLIELAYNLPVTLPLVSFCMFKNVEKKETTKESYKKQIAYVSLEENLITLYHKLKYKKDEHLKELEIIFFPLSREKIYSKTYLYVEKNNRYYRKRLLLSLPTFLLDLDLEKEKVLKYQKVPKYLKIEKLLPILEENRKHAILKIDCFPYCSKDLYLSLNQYDFFKHSLILGSSGSGKSKWLSLMISKLEQESYQVVVIDPHASLEKEIGGLEGSSIIDFETEESSINLFKDTSENVIATVELMLSLFSSLLIDSYNPKLERVLRNSIHLLLLGNRFSFKTLRKLILELEYRVECLKELEEVLPESIIDFFYNDFNELKTKSYMSAIAPILAFLDEVILLPGFQKEKIDTSLTELLSSSFLTIFSLDRTRLGDHMVRTIAGFLMQQILKIAEKEELNKKLVLVVDEVAVVENPVLTRILSEARKYNISLILIGQYLNQLSSSLLNAIFANTVNYYIFRSSRIDATTLVDHLNIDLKESKSKEDKIKLLTELNNRECIVRLSVKDKLQSSAKAHTLDFQSIPYNRKNAKVEQRKPRERETFSNTWTSSPISLRSILEKLSTNKRGTK